MMGTCIAGVAPASVARNLQFSRIDLGMHLINASTSELNDQMNGRVKKKEDKKK
jgi:hypothetical protein